MDNQEINTEIERLIRENAELKKEIEHLNRLMKSLNTRVKNLEQGGCTQSTSSKVSQENICMVQPSSWQTIDTTRSTYQTAIHQKPQRVSTVSYAADSAMINELLKQLQQAYNQLPAIRRRDTKVLAESFFQQYKIEGLKCANAEQVMGGVGECQFVSADPMDADIWVRSWQRNIFIGMPNKWHTYERIAHYSRGLNRLFPLSNFEDGKTYTVIRLETFAFLQKVNEQWSVMPTPAGKLHLSV